MTIKENNITFKVGDYVVYDGQLRPNCFHNNDEVGVVLMIRNSACQYYQIGVLDWKLNPIIVHKFETTYPLTWLANGKDLQPWKKG